MAYSIIVNDSGNLQKGNNMGGLLDKPEPVKAPPVPPPPPVPVVQEEAEEFALKEKVGRSGFEQTFLVGSLAPKSTGKKRKLG